MDWPPPLQESTRKTDKQFLGQVYRHAYSYSPDFDYKQAALLLHVNPGYRVLGYGVYGQGTTAVEHALEQAQPTRLVPGARLYAQALPLIDDAKLLADAGISELVVHRPFVERMPGRWHEEADCALELLDGVDVTIKAYDGALEDAKAFYDGEFFYG